MRALLVVMAVMALCCAGAWARTFEVASPDGRLVVTVEAGARLQYSLWWRGQRLIGPSPLGLHLAGGERLGETSRVVASHRATRDEVVLPAVYAKRRSVRDHHNALTLDFAGGWGLEVRAYDDALAWRLHTARPGTLRIEDEIASFRVARDWQLTLPRVDPPGPKAPDVWHTAYEVPYRSISCAAMRDRLGLLPALVGVPGGARLLITESDIEDYPGMWLSADADGLRGRFPPYPLQTRITDETYPTEVVTKRADYIAETTATRDFPWRIVAVAARDADLIENDVVFRLGGACQLADTSWIRPGKSQSEWIIDNNLYGVDFKAGWNTATYEFYADFLARFGFQYLFCDAGWSDVKDLSKSTPAMDMPRIIEHAKEKGLRVVLWTSAPTLEPVLDAAMNRFRELGVNGIMVDFMNRDDQKMVRFYERVARAAAQRRIFVDFHGAYKPDGMERRWPNVLTREAVIASEYHKWSDILTPGYEVTVPFIRMVAGPLDYEPGWMKNAQKADFRPVGGVPMSQGTRCHQLAMYVVYESPYSKAGGNPSDYLREPEIPAFIAHVPNVWAETHALDGRVGQFVVLRRTAIDGDIYLAAMSDWQPRTLQVPLQFLGGGKWRAEIFQDGVNADHYASDYKRIEREVGAAETLTLTLAPGGGFVGRFHRL